MRGHGHVGFEEDPPVVAGLMPVLECVAVAAAGFDRWGRSGGAFFEGLLVVAVCLEVGPAGCALLAVRAAAVGDGGVGLSACAAARFGLRVGHAGRVRREGLCW